MIGYQQTPPGADPAQMFRAYLAQQGGGTTPGYDLGAMTQPGIPSLGPLNLLAQPALASLAAQGGMFPGQFNPTVNVADMLRAENYRRNMQDAMRTATQTTDVNTWLQTTRGAMRALGQPFGLDQQAGFRQAYNDAAPIMSIMATMAPELVDRLHGSRGSAAVMTQHLFRGAQYRLGGDGMLGMQADDVRTLSETIEKRLYSNPSQVSEMLGVGMGQLGQIFDESQRRGYLPGSITARSRDAQVKAMADGAGKTVDEIKALDDAEFGRQLKQFDAGKVSGRLKELAQSVSAMRELFGSMGQPNAPMSQLLDALEAITQNKLATMPASQVEQTVRHTKALMETTGVGLDALLSTTSKAAAFGDQLGLDRSFAIGAGQHAVGFSSAYKNTFGNSFTAFGALSPDELMQREALFQQRAAASEQARYGGAVIRSVEALKLDGNTRAGRLSEALKSGATEFEGQSMYDVLRRDNLTNIFQQSGASPDGVAAFTTAMSDTFGNQEFIQKHDLGAMVRRLQPREITQRMGRGAAELALTPALMRGGMNQDDARNAAKQVAPDLLNALLNSESPEKLSTQQGRQEIIKGALANRFGDEKAAQMAPGVSLAFETHMNRQAQHYGFGDLSKLLQSQNRTVLQQEAKVQRTAAAEAEIDKMLSPLGKAGPLARVIDMIQAGKGNDDITNTLGKALGGLDVGDIRKLMADRDAFRNARIGDNNSPETIAATTRARERLQEGIKNIKTRAADAGVDVGRDVDDESVKRAVDSAGDVAKAVASKDTPERRLARIDRAARLQLTRANNLVQSLYLDDESVFKLGEGGVAQLKSIEGKYTQLLRVAGSPERIAKALADDPSIDADTRNQIKALQKSLSEEMAEVGATLTGPGDGQMPAEAKDAERKKLEKLRQEREASDGDQTKAMIDRMAKLGGIDTKDLSEEDYASLRKRLGGYGETKRKDILLAIDAREQLNRVAKVTGKSLDQLRKTGEYTDEFSQAGGLADFGSRGEDDLVGLDAALSSFGEQNMAGAGGKAKGRHEMTLTGTLRVQQDGTATITGVGYTDMDVG